MESSNGSCFYGWDEEIDLFSIETKNKNVYFHYNRPKASNQASSNLFSWAEILYLLDTGNLVWLLSKIDCMPLIGLDRLTPLELENCILQMNRVKTTESNAYEQFEDIRIILTYYYYILKSNNVNKVIIKNIPHLCIDYLFCVAARLLNINQEAWALVRGVSYQWSRIPLQQYFLFHAADPLTGAVKKLASTLIKPDYTGHQKAYELLFSHVRDLMQRFQSDIYGKDQYSGYIVKSHHEDRQKLFLTLQDDRIAFAIAFLAEVKRQYTLHSCDNLQDILINFKYIYLPLHKQPEMSTNPVAQDNWSQKMLILFWSRIADKLGMNLIVKEHPHMFKWSPQYASHFLTKQRFPRKAVDYEKLSQIDNVKFARLDLDSNTIATGKNCQAVVTVEGTIGAVAALAGKLTFVYGNPWYRYFVNVKIMRQNNNEKFSVNEILNSVKKHIPKTHNATNIEEYCQWYSNNFLLCKDCHQLSEDLARI